MARTNGVKSEQSEQSEENASTPADLKDANVKETKLERSAETGDLSESTAGTPDIDECLNSLKALLSTVEKLQKIRQEVGDIKPLLVRMLDGEVVSGEELEQLKTGVGGLFRLVRAYSDHQTALANAQVARTLLDQVLKAPEANRH